MKAVVLDADWQPRAGATITAEEEARRWSVNANLVWKHPRLAYRDVPDPGDPAAGEVLVRVENCGICGSDFHMALSDDDDYIYLPYHVACPVVVGHEFSGTVAAVGEGVTELAVGDLVTVEEIQPCGKCFACRGGYPNSCLHIEDFGFTIDGAFAEYAKAPVGAVWLLNSLVERYGSTARALEVGAMSEPCSVAYEAMFTRAGGFKPGMPVAVFGAGPIGLAATAMAAAAGASAVITFETGAARRSLAEKIGASHVLDPAAVDPVEVVKEVTKGNGVAMAVDATGNWPVIMPAVDQMLGVGGKAVIVGMGPVAPTIELIHYQLKAASLYGSVGHCGGWDFGNVIGLMSSGRIHMEHAITRCIPLTELVDVLSTGADPSDGKVLVKPVP